MRQNIKYTISNTNHTIPNTKYTTENIKYLLPKTKYQTSNVEFPTSDVKFPGGVKMTNMKYGLLVLNLTFFMRYCHNLKAEVD